MKKYVERNLENGLTKWPVEKVNIVHQDQTLQINNLKKYGDGTTVLV